MQWCRSVGLFLFVARKRAKTTSSFLNRQLSHSLPFGLVSSLFFWPAPPAVDLFAIDNDPRGSIYRFSPLQHPEKAQNNKKQQQTKYQNMCGTLAIL